jgi:hypothetical protein
MSLLSDREDFLKLEVTEWRTRLNQALLRVENRRLYAAKLLLYPDDTRVHFPHGPVADLQLLTLKVWTLRYIVTPEFLLDHITTKLSYCRQKATGSPETGNLNVGFPAGILASPRARTVIEEAVKVEYPNGENRKILTQPKVSPIQASDFDTTHQMLETYKVHAEIAQKRFNFRMRKRNQVTVGERNYRKSLLENE